MRAAAPARSCSRCSEGIPGISRFETGDLPGWKCWKKKASIPFPELPKIWAAFRSPEGTENPAQAQRPGGGGKASESPHSLDDSPVPCEPAQSFTGGWRLLMTRQLSPEQSGTSSASLGPSTAGNGAPPEGSQLRTPRPDVPH